MERIDNKDQDKVLIDLSNINIDINNKEKTDLKALKNQETKVLYDTKDGDDDSIHIYRDLLDNMTIPKEDIYKISDKNDEVIEKHNDKREESKYSNIFPFN
jgi:hypothetical protein